MNLFAEETQRKLLFCCCGDLLSGISDFLLLTVLNRVLFSRSVLIGDQSNSVYLDAVIHSCRNSNLGPLAVCKAPVHTNNCFNNCASWLLLYLNLQLYRSSHLLKFSLFKAAPDHFKGSRLHPFVKCVGGWLNRYSGVRRTK